ncbi:hypothetical protein JKP88DRAFT_316513, partial [Tribonema minus]
MECGGGVRRRAMVCAEFRQGVAVGSVANATHSSSGAGAGGNASRHSSGFGSSSSSSALNDDGGTDDAAPPGDVQTHSEQEEACREVPCLSSFLQVSLTLSAFYGDACFTADAQRAFLSGLALEIVQALHITLSRIRDMNAAPAARPDEMVVSFIVAPPSGPADQPIRVLQEQLKLQVSSANSSLRSRGTWARLVVPSSIREQASVYLPQNLQVRFLAYDVIILLVVVGSACLLCAGWGAWTSSRRRRGKLLPGYCDVEDAASAADADAAADDDASSTARQAQRCASGVRGDNCDASSSDSSSDDGSASDDE